MSAISPDYLNRHKKNLRFFKSYDAAFYQRLTKVNYERVQLSIEPESDQLNVIDHGTPLYGQCARLYATKENQAFWQTCRDGEKVGWLPPPVQGDHYYPRYFHQHMERFLAQAPLKDKTQWTGYPIKTPIPLLVVLGVGVGVHFQQCIEQKRCKNAVLYEPLIEKFAISLFVVDWLEIFRMAAEYGTTIHLTVGHGDNDPPSNEFLFNKLLSFKPHYPITTLFYNHLGSTWGEALVAASRSHFLSHHCMLGNYDDEVNQMNQALYHLLHGVKMIPTMSFNRSFNELTYPVVVVGSGPSLDDGIECIKTLRDKVILVSCGTAINALYKEGVVPDFHVESESDYSTVSLLAALEDRDYLAKIVLLGPLQLNPSVTQCFRDFYTFFRSEAGISKLLQVGEQEALVLSGLTNCLVAGTILLMEIGFKEFYLFGADLGFKNVDSHHSKRSGYYDEQPDPILQIGSDYSKIPTFSVIGVQGRPMLTEARFLAVKYLLESNLAKRSDLGAVIYNCSNGLDIIGTKHIPLDELEIDHLIPKESRTQCVATDFLNQGFTFADSKSVLTKMTLFKVELERLCQKLISLLDDPIADINELPARGYTMQDHLDKVPLDCRKMIRVLLLGSLQHYFYTGYAQIAMLDDDRQGKYLEMFVIELRRFLADLCQHFDKFLDDVLQDRISDLLHRSIREPDTI